MLLGARPALLMQLAHPLVAQGVEDYSGFQGDRLGRLARTLRASTTIVFGSRAEADAVIDRIRQVHGGIEGTLVEGVGRWPAGHGYRAQDPDLLMWVHASLIDVAIRCYESFAEDLSDLEKDGYVASLAEPAQRLGIPRAIYPESYSALVGYIAEMIRDGSVAVGPSARRVARPILFPAVAGLPDRLFDPLTTITASLLPPAITRGYGLRAGGVRQLAFRSIATSSKVIRPLLPPAIRRLPAARSAV